MTERKIISGMQKLIEIETVVRDRVAAEPTKPMAQPARKEAIPPSSGELVVWKEYTATEIKYMGQSRRR